MNLFGSEIRPSVIEQRIFGGVFVIGANWINPKIVFKKDTVGLNIWFIATTEKKYSEITGLEKDGKKILDIRFSDGYSFYVRFIDSTQRDEVYKFLIKNNK